jgi:hypothetical protein
MTARKCALNLHQETYAGTHLAQSGHLDVYSADRLLPTAETKA